MRFPPSKSHALTLPLLLLASACGYSNPVGGYGGGYGGAYGGGGTAAACPPGTQVVAVGAGPDGISFDPASVTIHVNDTVCWTWLDGPHSVVSGTPCVADNAFCSPVDTACASAPGEDIGAAYTHKFTAPGTFPYFCGFHCSLGMVGSVTVLP